MTQPNEPPCYLWVRYHAPGNPTANIIKNAIRKTVGLAGKMVLDGVNNTLVFRLVPRAQPAEVGRRIEGVPGVVSVTVVPDSLVHQGLLSFE
jgi:hypothetical protein